MEKFFYLFTILCILYLNSVQADMLLDLPVYNTSCGGIYNDSTGIVTSPNYPNDYPESIQCQYKFIAPKGYVVEIIFMQFEIDSKENENDCLFDRLQLHDGPEIFSPSLTKAMCGNEESVVPGTVVESSGRYLTMFFHVDEISTGGKGFQIRYTMIKDEDRPKSCIINTCGGTFTNFRGCEFQTPHYPHDYLSNQNCTWVIEAPNPNDKLHIKVLASKLRSSFPREGNSFTLRDGALESDNLMRRLFKITEIKPNLTTSGPKLRMHFQTINEDKKLNPLSDVNHYTGVAVKVTVIPGPVVSTTTTKTTLPPTTLPPTTLSKVLKTTTTPRLIISTTKDEPKVETSSTIITTTTEKIEEPKNNKTVSTDTQNGVKIPPSAMSGLVIGVIVGILIIVLMILTFVAFVHWKRQNYRIRLRTEDDQHDLINNMAEEGREVGFHKSGGRIVRSQNQENSQL